MAVTVTLRWKGHSLADATTQYEIQSDVATPNTYLPLTTRPATTPYAPVATTLNGEIAAGATVLAMGNATGFANGETIQINREFILLGGKVGNVFNACVRGQLNTIPQAHADGSFIYKAHETYPVAGVDFGLRHVIRYRIIALMQGARLVAAEAVAVQPTLPSTNDKLCVWGVQDKLDGTPQAGVEVQMSVEPRAFNPGTAETIDATSLTTTTDVSGYWQFITHKDVAKSNGGAISIRIDQISYELAELPDVDTICFLECLA